MTSRPLVVNPARASSEVEHDWRSHIVFEVTPAGPMCEKFHQLLAVGRWFPPGTPVSSTRKLISSSFHRLDMTLAVAEALNPNKPNQTKPAWQGAFIAKLMS